MSGCGVRIRVAQDEMVQSEHRLAETQMPPQVRIGLPREIRQNDREEHQRGRVAKKGDASERSHGRIGGNCADIRETRARRRTHSRDCAEYISVANTAPPSQSSSQYTSE